MSILNWQVNFSSNFASFFIVMTYNSPVNFKLIHFLLWIKGSHQSPAFETFNFSGENLPNSSYHFCKHNSALIQMLRQSLVPSNITPNSNIIHFGQRQTIMGHIFEIFECSCQNSFKFFMSTLNWQVHSSSNFKSLSSFMKDNPSLLFKLKHFVQQLQC